MNRRRIAVGCVIALAAALPGCRKHAAAGAAVAPAVTVQSPKPQPVTEYLDLTGTVAASKTVNLVARVPGYLESVDFKDGAVVSKGQLLFVIEQAPYQAQVALNQAALVRAQAELDRQQSMMKENATAETTVENWVSQRDQAKAQLELAQINLEYTKVTAPFDGRLGARQVDPGNLVGSSGPTVLATIEQLHPIYVNFNLNERDALQHARPDAPATRSRSARTSARPRSRSVSRTRRAIPTSECSTSPTTRSRTSTGTIALRGVFENEDTTLFPGLFARVRIPLGGPAAHARRSRRARSATTSRATSSTS